MAKESKEKKKGGLIAGFKDPVKRPRFIMWTGVALIGICAFLVVGFIGSSTYWFCGSFCHSVQGDAVAAYDNGAHNKVSCLTCHEPVNGDPLSFTYRKVEAGVIGVYELATTTYALPLNATSHLALNQSAFSGFSDDHCTQCHTLENREITPSEGIIINHDAHTDREIHCTACHNRVAHPEDEIEIATVNPKTGEPGSLPCGLHDDDRVLPLPHPHRRVSLRRGVQGPGHLLGVPPRRLRSEACQSRRVRLLSQGSR